jgi:hypothetical protein
MTYILLDSQGGGIKPRALQLGEWLFMGRRSCGVAGLSLAASAGLLGTYVGYPGLRKAHAATTCQVTSPSDTVAPLTAGELRYCLDQVNTSGGAL